MKVIQCRTEKEEEKQVTGNKKAELTTRRLTLKPANYGNDIAGAMDALPIGVRTTQIKKGHKDGTGFKTRMGGSDDNCL